ncbi:hypothetical protein ACKKBF_B39610 [Auxenochlorella protothecoides x Auxenochlorella symbiontica]
MLFLRVDYRKDAALVHVMFDGTLDADRGRCRRFNKTKAASSRMCSGLWRPPSSWITEHFACFELPFPDY